MLCYSICKGYSLTLMHKAKILVVKLLLLFFHCQYDELGEMNIGAVHVNAAMISLPLSPNNTTWVHHQTVNSI